MLPTSSLYYKLTIKQEHHLTVELNNVQLFIHGRQHTNYTKHNASKSHILGKHRHNIKFKKSPQEADSHHLHHAELVAAYLQSQSQASSLRQCRDKTQWILVISTFYELGSHVTANWGELQKYGSKKL